MVLDRLKRKFANAPKYLPKPVIIGKGNNEVGIVSVGSCDGAIREALDVLRRQKIEVDYLRVKAFPFNNDVEAFLKSHATIFVVEQNRDAQLKSLLTLETAVEKSKLFSILSYSGLPMSAAAHRQRNPRQARRSAAADRRAALSSRSSPCHTSTSPKSPIRRCRPMRWG